MKYSFDRNRLREAMGNMSAIELADKLGCGKSSISMYLAGQREPSKMAVQLIALVLGVNPLWLCGVDVPVERTTPIPDITENGRKARLVKLFDRLPESEQDEIISLIEWKLSRK